MIDFRKHFDHRKPDSLSASLRSKRFQKFKVLIDKLSRPLKILDVGGTVDFWEKTKLIEDKEITITILNLLEGTSNYANLVSTKGDVRDMVRYSDDEFDIVFSNSTIEHLGEYEDQRRCADEIKRIGKRYFIQTPNKYFPIEPHFLYPFFQFYPKYFKALLVLYANIGWYPADTWEKAIGIVCSVKLLSKSKIRGLFLEAEIFEEKFFGITKSFIAYHGW